MSVQRPLEMKSTRPKAHKGRGKPHKACNTWPNENNTRFKFFFGAGGNNTSGFLNNTSYHSPQNVYIPGLTLNEWAESGFDVVQPNPPLTLPTRQCLSGDLPYREE